MITRRLLRGVRALAPALLALTPIVCSERAEAQELPSPEDALGHIVGADGHLADYEQLLAWWHELAERSPRMILERMGPTSYGQDQVLAVITSVYNHERLEDLRLDAQRLALGRDADEEVARALAREGRVVIWIDAGLHATESIAAQNILELVWQMVSRDDDEVKRILDQVILVVCPANPDGMQMVARAYRATKRVGGLPVLYQRYVGHDNNRDFYAANSQETRNILFAQYHRWYPRVIYNHHQSAPRGTIIYTPPFRDPFNFNVDPLVIRGIEIISAHMNHRFASEGKPGVISRSGASYSTWWNGGLRTTGYFHNVIGILTEVYGHPDPQRLSPGLNRKLPYSDYPDPVQAQTWHARQTIEYLQTSNFAILDYASRYREEMLLDGWRLARRSIDRGSRDHWTPTPELLEIAKERDEAARQSRSDTEAPEATPQLPAAFADPDLRDARVYVLPADQADPAAATRLVRALRRNAIEVEIATEAIDLPSRGRPAPAGSYVLRTAQAYRAHLRDMLEPQWHPDDLGTGGEPVRPYDSAGWTLSMQMGVEVVRLRDETSVTTKPLAQIEAPFLAREASEGSKGWLLDPQNCNAFWVANLLLARGHALGRALDPVTLENVELPCGTFFVPASVGAATAAELARDFGVAFHGVDAKAWRIVPLIKPRIGLFDGWGGNMATGWTESVLREWGFDVQLVFGERILAGDLAHDFDVLVFHSGVPSARGGRGSRGGRSSGSIDDERIKKLREQLPAFEDWSTLEARRVRLTTENAVDPLRAFLSEGKRIVALGSAATALTALLELPVEEGLKVPDEESDEERRVRSSEFFIPGSLIRARADNTNPLAFGCPERLPVMFRRSPVYTPTSDQAQVIVSYETTGPLLASGWEIGAELLRGKAAAVHIPVDHGSVVLFGADVVYRGQPVGTFKLLFNALLAAE